MRGSKSLRAVTAVSAVALITAACSSSSTGGSSGGGTDNKKVTIGELPFVTVAYGLSNIGLSIPEALTPDEVPPMPDRAERRNRLDREDIYAK